ncbi:MAG: undecaprenyl/decaprenyl-phosphate alpha-N-acetylglucosaminyl 1-phosphate transferase [Ktedonobacterales bacterium]|nr:undecaprenyl/decaprenyl-phosphate alpha-N-acetylglucosaminyl 1-phosphate transferase [Ktedonobacterales bacterium]
MATIDALASRAALLPGSDGRAQLLAALLGFPLAAALTLGLSLAVARLCRRWRLLDMPEPRRIHPHPVPRLGGIAIFLSFLGVSLLLFRPASAYEQRVYVGLVVAAVLVVVVMAYDDVRGLPPLPRLGVQTLAALIVMFPAGQGTLIQVIHNPLVVVNDQRTFLALWLAIPFTWFWIVGMMNTINWVDGVDGLAGGVVTITALVMAVISWMLGQHEAAILCAILAGATFGFLPLNWHPARLFMGDSGAMFLGLALAVLANVGGAKLATMLLLLGLPILDTARVIVRRLRQGSSPLRFDTSHLHHRLLARGFSQWQIVLLFYAVTASFGGLTMLAAYLQVHASQRRLRLHLLPWLNVAVSELPTLLGLVLLLLVSTAIWRVAASRRRRVAGPDTAPLRLPPPPPLLTPSPSGAHHQR